MEEKLEEKNEVSTEISQFDKFLIPGSIVIAGIVIAGAVLYSGGFIFKKSVSRDIPQESATVDAADIGNFGTSLGDPKAPIVLVEFSDFQCPFCRQFWRENFSQLKEKYIKTGKVRLVYRHFPLSFHPSAEIAAVATICARDQDKFWEMHDKIFSEQDKQGNGTISFSEGDLKKWAQAVGMNAESFNSCLSSNKHKDEIEKDVADGAALGVRGTPNIFVNGKLLIPGALPFIEVAKILDQVLTRN